MGNPCSLALLLFWLTTTKKTMAYTVNSIIWPTISTVVFFPPWLLVPIISGDPIFLEETFAIVVAVVNGVSH